MHIPHDYYEEMCQKSDTGGDQLTCERQACAKRLVICGNTKEGCLQSLEPNSEDWHALMCFLNVLWKVLHKDSYWDHGTFGHLFSVLGRFSASKLPQKDMNSCCDSVFIVIMLQVLAKY